MSGSYSPLLQALLGGPQTTELTPVGEQLFQQQAGSRAGDTADYDLRGAWAQQGGGPFGEGHLTDLWKLPNHPTFSSGSVYANTQTPGGVWSQLPSGQWTFMPSQTNYDRYGRAALEDYFAKFEPNNVLLSR